MTQKNITLIRHAESQANAGGVTLTPESIELTKRGHQQAQRLAASLEDIPQYFLEEYASSCVNYINVPKMYD
jgi:alpha-ribazole phosphatase